MDTLEEDGLPRNGAKVYWRFSDEAPVEFQAGYVQRLRNGLVQMQKPGSNDGPVLLIEEIEFVEA